MGKEKRSGVAKSIKKGTQILIVILILAVLLAGVFLFQSAQSSKEEERVSTISEASLEKMMEISELSTVDYTYNAIAKAYDEEQKKVKYYVAYEGIVTAGIDFEKIKIHVNEEDKKVTVTLPAVEIQDVKIDMGTMDYIFVRNKFETETVSQEAYKVCLKDLENRVKKEEALYQMAEENAAASLKALFTPWIEQIDEEYTVEINQGGQ